MKYIRENTDAKIIFEGEASDEIGQGSLYFNKQPDEHEGDVESRRLLRDAHLHDTQTADRMTSAHGSDYFTLVI